MICIDDFDFYFSKLFSNPSSLLDEAIQYSVLNGGKRLRPRLLLATFNSCLLSDQNLNHKHDLVLRTAYAVEMVHSGSLIHDDLPIFDNSLERRGKTSVHIKYGEQIALLSGDVLIANASEVLAKDNGKILTNETLKLIILLNRAVHKLCLGQSLESIKNLTSNEIEYYHSLKTSSLFSFCTAAGGIINGYEDISKLERLGSNIGSIYQLVDDLYDTNNHTNLQSDKPVNQDAKLERPNFVSLNGAEQTKQKIFSLLNDSKDIINSLPNPKPLMELLDHFSKMIK